MARDGIDVLEFWSYWYFHLPNYFLAVVIYTILGRFLLALFVPAEWDNYIWRNFCRLTDPMVRVAAAITPRMVPPLFLLLLTAFWVFLLRIAFMMAMLAAGLTPPIPEL